MTDTEQVAQRSHLQRYLLIAGIVLIAINLRPALAGVGPLVNAIRQDTGLSNTLLGLLTTLPLLAFGVCSTLTSLFTRRFGIEMTLAGALVLLTAGTLLRILPSIGALFAGTLILGVAIAMGNVLLPSLVKRDFPDKSGVMTSLYSSVLGLGATLAAGLSIPLARDLGLGWRGSLGSWAILSFLALLVWLPQLRHQTLPEHTRSFRKALKRLGSSRLAWQVALFMGLQSLTFYVILAWLPEILQGRGLDPGYAGWMLSLSQGVGMLGTIFIPTWAERRDDQRNIVWLLTLLEIVGLVGLMYTGLALTPIWVSLIGFTLGGSFGLSLLFIVLRTSDTETATELSGMAQSAGYLLAATGPALFGFFYDLTGAWFIPLVFLIAVVVAKLLMGLGAGRPRELNH